jgi:ribosome-associated heat shock protein Hsp15
VEAVNGGKVHLEGQRTKPGKEIHVGSQLQISKGSLEWDIRVEQLSAQRRPAVEARHFYSEDATSTERRRHQVEQQRAQAKPRQPQGKPNKRDRRLIHRFKQVE